MAFEFSEQVLQAFEARETKAELDRFVAWWYHNRQLLGVMTPDQAPATLEQALALGMRVGVDDNSENRLFLLAAAQRLLPSPTPRQEILAMDAVFAPTDDADRLAQLAALRPATG